MKPEVIKGDDPQLGSPIWYEFLEMPDTKSFRYVGIAGSFTANKRNDGAWNAYRKLFGKLRQEYLGLSSALSPIRLEEIAAKLALEDLDYWTAKARSKKESSYNRITLKNIPSTASSDSLALAEALEKISNLEQQLEESQQLAARVEKAIAILREGIPLKANAGGAIKEKIRQALVLLEN